MEAIQSEKQKESSMKIKIGAESPGAHYQERRERERAKRVLQELDAPNLKVYF